MTRVFGLTVFLLNVIFFHGECKIVNFDEITNGDVGPADVPNLPCNSVEREIFYDFKILHLNAQSLTNKLTNFEVLLADKSPDIVCVVEHWCNGDNVQLMHIEGYKLVSCFCRSGRIHGGAMIFARDGLKVTTIDVTRFTMELDCEACAVLVSLPTEKFSVVSVYRSTLGSSQATVKVDPATLPTFLTSSQVFKVTEKDTVVLPCEVSNLGEYVIVWKKGNAVLTAGFIRVTPDRRVNLLRNYSLEIKETDPHDAGDYVCQIGTIEPREITHTVEILVPPRIVFVSSNGRVEIKKGSSIRLECKASGNPVPKITWSRKNNLLPNGEQTAITPILTLDNVDRHQAGVYQCTAGNGVGEDVREQIVLHVLYPPEISVESPVVHSAEGLEAQLVCIVHGESQPEVLWYRDTMQLDTTERRIMESRGSRHTLFIRKVSQSDFGNYTCVADNQLGKTRKSVQLTGKPNAAKFNSASRGNWKDSYNISWAVESLSPIEEYKLLYRRLPDTPDVATSEDGHPQPLHHQSQKKFMFGKDNKTYSSIGYNTGVHGYGRQYIDRRTDWRDVIVPAQNSDNPAGIQSMNYMIRGLQPAQNYEAKVQARNKFGWSPFSESFTFQTTDIDMSYPERPQLPRNVYNENEIRDLGIRIYNVSRKIRSYALLYLVGMSFIILI